MKILLTSDETIPVNTGETIYGALKRSGIFLVASCGGKGTCGKCKVKVLQGPHETESYGKLTPKERQDNIVLACQTRPTGDLLLEILKEAKLVVGDKIAIAKTKDLLSYLRSYDVEINPPIKRVSLELPPPTISDHISDLERMKRALENKGLSGLRFSHGFVSTMGETLRYSNWKVELTYQKYASGIGGEALFVTSPEFCSRRFGIAVDIGTTTIVVYLVNMVNGEIVDIGSTYNSQMRFGDDVITRVIHATEGGGLDELREAVVSDINAIVVSLKERHGIETCEIDSATISGNTIMSHIFWGIDPSSIREEPYIPALNFFPNWRGGTARLAINAQAPVYTAPCIASYVGGDIAAGILASKMHRNAEVALFMDIGTNGEIAIGNNEWLMAAACSAGPCFEGSGIRCGMRATSGAIESVRIDPATYEPQLGIIGGGHALGICGSGMIDAISEMFLTGIIDQKGKYTGVRTDRIRTGEEGREFLFYHDEKLGRDIVLTEVDIENILRSKAAIYAGVATLLNEVGFPLDAIEKVYIAGGFGNYINVKRAILIGMLPDIPAERYVFMGNTSITGSYLCLLSRDLRQELETIASRMTYVELSVSRGFMDEYMSALFLPHTNIDLFPSVKKLMEREEGS